MGAAASAPPEAAASADPPAKGDMQPAAAAASPPPEAAAPADPPAKVDIQPAAAAADAPEKEEIQSAPPADAAGGDAEAEGETVVLDAAEEAGGEEEDIGECPFCLFMKGGGCKEEFVVWEKCVEEAEAETGGVDVVERCTKATTALRSCMDKYADYYEPILRVERKMSENLEADEAEAEASQSSDPSPPAVAEAEGEQGDSKKQAEEVVVEEKEDLAA